MPTQAIRIAVLTVLLAGAHAQQQGSPETKQAPSAGSKTAAQQIVRLSPAAVPQLPEAVRAELERRGCLIPQSIRASGPENFTSGRFRDAGGTDWAVLCSVNGFTSILVFFQGSAGKVEEIGKRADADYLQARAGGGPSGFSRRITTASPDAIHKRKQNRKVGPFDHDGIEDAFLGQGSLIHYFRNGQWVDLEGAD